MDNRPRWLPEWTAFDKAIEIISWLLLLFLWSLVLVIFFSLPDTIPLHFNSKGEVNGYGEKYVLFLFPAIITVVFLVIGEAAKRPWHFNFVIAPTEGNYQELYRLNIRALRMIRFIVTVMSTYITYAIITGAREGGYQLSIWAVPVFIIGIIAPAVYTVIKSLKLK